MIGLKDGDVVEVKVTLRRFANTDSFVCSNKITLGPPRPRLLTEFLVKQVNSHKEIEKRYIKKGEYVDNISGLVLLPINKYPIFGNEEYFIKIITFQPTNFKLLGNINEDYHISEVE